MPSANKQDEGDEMAGLVLQVARRSEDRMPQLDGEVQMPTRMFQDQLSRLLAPGNDNK